MAKVKFVTRTNIDGTEVEHALIDKGNGEFISMPKETYLAQTSQESAAIVTEDV